MRLRFLRTWSMPFSQIDIVPLQGKEFPLSHACGEGKNEERFQSAATSCSKKTTGFIREIDFNLNMPLAWRIDHGGDISRNEAKS